MKWFASHSNAIKQHMSCCSWEVSFVISSFLKLKKERCVVASQHFFAFKDCRDQLFNFTSALLFLLDGGFQLPRIAWCQLTAVDSSRASLAPGLSLTTMTRCWNMCKVNKSKSYGSSWDRHGLYFHVLEHNFSWLCLHKYWFVFMCMNRSSFFCFGFLFFHFIALL